MIFHSTISLSLLLSIISFISIFILLELHAVDEIKYIEFESASESDQAVMKNNPQCPGIHSYDNTVYILE